MKSVFAYFGAVSLSVMLVAGCAALLVYAKWGES